MGLMICGGCSYPCYSDDGDVISFCNSWNYVIFAFMLLTGLTQA